MSGWDFKSNNENSNTQKAEFTKFPVGITRVRILDEAPFVRWTHWDGKNRRSINCPGKGCPICEIRKQQKANKEPYTHNMARRFAINVHNLETNKVEIMEQGIGVFEDLRDLKEDINESSTNLNEAIIKVRRRGTTKDDTSYRLDVDEIQPLASIDLERFNSQRITLSEYFKPHTPEQILRLIQGEPWEEVMKSEQEESTSGNEDNEDIEIR